MIKCNMPVNLRQIVVFLLYINVFVKTVLAGFGPNAQDWGYVNVREKAHMFWWLHYTTATEDYVQRPLVIWLQGGPGGSSTGIGNFHEIGPWDTQQNIRNLSWTNYLNVLFVDNPVGTGFSFVENATDTSLFANDNVAIANDFLVLLKGFLSQKPEFQQVPLYIFGQSYGGKMTVDITLKLYNEIQANNISCNFKGIGLGDAWISPIEALVSWPLYLLNLGFIDNEQYDLLKLVTETAKTEIELEGFRRATAFFQTAQIFINRLTTVNYYNVLEPVQVGNASAKKTKSTYSEVLDILAELGVPVDEDLLKALNEFRDHTDVDEKLFGLMNGPVKSALNISTLPCQWGEQSESVFQAVNLDFMKPVVDNLERILNETDIEVNIYNGQLDLLVNTLGTMNWVNNLRWSGAADWKLADRVPITVKGINEGYSKSFGKFRFFWINRAGHAVPTDNPHTMEYVLSATTNNYNNKYSN